MTNEEKLNKAVTAYKAGMCGFDEVYAAYIKIYGTQYEKIALAYDLDKHDVQAGYEDTLFNTVTKFEPAKGVYTHFLKRSLRNKLTDLQRERSKWDREISYNPLPSGDPDEKNVFYVIPSDQNVEDIVAEKEISDKQRILIAEILADATNAGLDIKNVCREIMAGNTVHSAAKHFGICHKTVKRRMKRLAKCYDVHKYGDIKDYLIS